MGVLILILMCIVSLWGAQLRRRRWYLYVAGFSALGIALGLVVPELGLAAPEPTPRDAVLLFGLVLLAIDVAGLPRSVALRTRLGLHSDEWLYDGKLYRLLKPLNDLLDAEPSLNDPSHEEWRRRVVELSRSTLTRARRLRAPNHKWAALTASYVEVYDTIVDVIQTGDDGSRRSWVRERNKAIDLERERLRRRYRDEARTGVTGGNDPQ